MIKTMLVLADDMPGFEATLVLAVELGRRFAAHLDVLYVRDDPTALPPLAGVEVTPDVLETIRITAEKAADEREAAAKAVYDRILLDADVASDWLVDIGPQPDIAAAEGRLRDIILVGRPGDDADDALWRRTLDQILFDSGRPVLLVPLAPPPSFGERIALAWNGSAQATHAVAASLPFLHSAKRVTVLSTSAAARGASAAALVSYLARHDIQAFPQEFETGYDPVGAALLKQTKASHANLMVMGAYSHSRLREVVLGGATREVIDAADLPVLMAH